MKTRITDIPGAGFSFQYAEGKRPQPHDWHFVGGFNIKTWRTAEQRDRARACFSHRRSVQAALADVKKAGLLPAGEVCHG
jgi:hypothetical protein